MTRHRFFALIAAGLVACGGLLGPLQAQAADPAHYIALSWDADPTDLTWTEGDSAGAVGGFFGHPVVVPGDGHERTAWVRNDGPSAAIATVQVFNIGITGTDSTGNHELADLIHLTWSVAGQNHDVTWREASQIPQPWSVQFDVGRGESFSITAGYYFPASATGGMSSGGSGAALTFDVHVVLADARGADPQVPSHPVVPEGPGGQTGGWIDDRVSWPTLIVIGSGLAIWLVWRRHQEKDNPLARAH